MRSESASHAHFKSVHVCPDWPRADLFDALLSSDSTKARQWGPADEVAWGWVIPEMGVDFPWGGGEEPL